MKRILILFILLYGSSLFSQNLELNGGVNHNVFFIYHPNNSPHHHSYSSANGYQIGVGINDVEWDSLQWRFTLNYINYGGGFDATWGGLGGATTIAGNVSKSVLSVGIYPLNVKFFKRIDFNLGLEISCLLSEKVNGRTDWWMMGGDMGSSTIGEKYKQFSAKGYVGLSARIAYPIRISEKFSISPQLGCYFGGLSSEFYPDPLKNVRSFRQCFSVGIQRKLK